MSMKIAGPVLALTLLSTAPALARCGSQPGDAAAVATIRARAAMQCDCATAFSRSTYVHCVRMVADTAVMNNELSPQCASAVNRCASKSTCGRAGAVVCQRTARSGSQKCSIKRDAAHCRAPSGGSECIVAVPSCCDVNGCSSTSTTTSPTTSTTSTTQVGGTTTTTTTNGGSTTTTSLPGAGEDQLVFTTAPGTTDCGGAGLASPAAAPFSGALDSDTACSAHVADLGLSCLYFGGGNATVVPPGKIPDQASTALGITGPTTLGPSSGTSSKDCSRAAGPGRHCVNNNSVPSCTSDAQCGGLAGSCALDANCFFGPPLPILSPPPFNALTTCVMNVVQSDAGGTFNGATGDTSVSLPLSSRVYITGNSASPCPKCLSGACDSTWKTNTNAPGPDAGHACAPTGASLTSTDCRPSLPGFQAPLGIDLTPLTTGTAAKTAASGLFCPGQNNAGAFGQTTAQCVQETGSAAGNLSDGMPHPASLGAVFCIPATGNGAVDGVADLPGPGAIGLNGNAQIFVASGSTTTTVSTTTETTTPTTSTTTTTLALVCTSPLVSLPPFGNLAIQILAGTTNCGGAGLSPVPSAPFAGQLLDGSNASIVSLGSGCLYVGGGGNTALPPGRVPDGADITLGVVGIQGLNIELGPSAGTGPRDCSKAAGPASHCIAGTNTGAACTADVDCGGLPGSCALDANCIFGPPLPLPSPPPFGALTSCIVNVVQQNMCGEIELLQGGATLNAALSSRVYLTGNLASPCPRCVSSACNAGPNSGQACQAVGALGTSLDCPPAPAQFVAPLNVVLSPLTTGTLNKTDAAGLFCPGQAQPGAFGRGTARTIRTQGTGLTGSTTLQLTAAGPFCVPATGNSAIDGVADVAGPGAVSVPSQTDAAAILRLLGLPVLPGL